MMRIEVWLSRFSSVCCSEPSSRCCVPSVSLQLSSRFQRRFLMWLPVVAETLHRCPVGSESFPAPKALLTAEAMITQKTPILSGVLLLRAWVDLFNFMCFKCGSCCFPAFSTTLLLLWRPLLLAFLSRCRRLWRSSFSLGCLLLVCFALRICFFLFFL